MSDKCRYFVVVVCRMAHEPKGEQWRPTRVPGRLVPRVLSGAG